MTLSGMVQRWRRFCLVRRGLRLDTSCYVGPGVSLGLDAVRAVRGKIRVGSGCQIQKGVELNPFGGSITLGENVWLGPNLVIYGQGGVEVGDDCLLSMNVVILSSSHRIPGRDRHIRWEHDDLRPTRIGRDVWIGANAVILGGVTIGEGCVVAAGAVVTKNLPAYSVAMGVPAKVVRSRSG